MQLITENEHRVWDAACLELDDVKGIRTNAHVLDAIQGAMTYRRVTLNAEELERCRRALEEHFVVSQGHGESGSELKTSVIPPWVPGSKPSKDWPFWFRYQKLMKSKISPEALEGLDVYTDRILDKIGDPKRRRPEQPATWDVRGMVAGHVQSGKTSNYVGLICKAADAGYKMIVILSGIHENLRVQTQGRIDEGFIGRGASGDPKQFLPTQLTGVGKITVPGLQEQPLAIWGTTQHPGGDFRMSKLTDGLHISPSLPPVVFVVKKNVTVLRTLLKWVVGKKDTDLKPGATGEYEDKLHDVPHFYRKDCPLLVIDDEADQASVDTKSGNIREDGDANPDHDSTKINRLIRSLLRSFSQSAYVGYTATPFANILIHDGAHTKTQGDDLFPRNFIVNLPTPAAYVGPATIFGLSANSELEIEPRRGLPELVVEVDDHTDDPNDLTGKQGWMPPVHLQKHEVAEAIPKSLHCAILDWVLAGAGMVLRGRSHEHHSMLIHVTRFVKVIGSVQAVIEAAWEDTVEKVRQGEPAMMAKLKARWEESFLASRTAVLAVRPDEESLMSEICWADLVKADSSGLNALQTAVDGVKVLQVHGGEDGDNLDYRQQLKVIAIGGNKLSRGLTLENLTVSYFLRPSKMYDTLMQMGRWFGYRNGLLDLCRLYMPSELRRWFVHMSNATEELRAEFERMATQGATPKDFGLRVRSHPTMAVTSSIKMRHAEKVRVSFSDTRPETIVFDTSKATVEGNWKALQALVQALGPAHESDPIARRGEQFRGFLWEGVSAVQVVHFLEKMKAPDSVAIADGPRISQYISKMSKHDELINWTVLLRHNPTAPANKSDSLPHLPFAVGRSRRGRDETANERSGIFAIRVLIDSLYESVDIGEPAFKSAVEMNKAEKRAAKKKEPETPGPYIRRVRPKTDGLLLLYTVQPSSRSKDDGKDADFSIGADLPLVGFAVSFPTAESAEVVEYVVSPVYLAQEDLQRDAEAEPTDE